MFFRKKRDLPPRPPSPPWLKWVIVGFLVLATIGNSHKGTPVNQAFQQAATDLNPKKIFNLADYKGKIFPSYKSELRIRDGETGQGEPAVCGQQVNIAYEAFLNDRKLDDAQETLTFRIGDGKAMPAFEQGVIGMKTGGKRSLFAPPGMSYGIEKYARQDVPAEALVRFEVDMLGITPPLPDAKTSPYRITTVTDGNGPALLCGDRVQAQITIWDVSGKKLYSTEEPIVFTPGKSQVFLGLEQGVIGMNKGGARLLVVPPAFQNTMNGNTPLIDFPFPEKQTVLVDVEIVP